MIAHPALRLPAAARAVFLRLAALLRLAAAALLALAIAAPAPAEPVPGDLVRAGFLGGWRTESGTQMSALRLDLAEGWKTYWRAPGEAGIPPQFDWSGSDNVASVRVHWPTPEVFHLNGMRTIGYKHHLVLPLEITPRDASRPIHLSASIDMGVCRDICGPGSLRLGADLPQGGTPDAAIRAALADGPMGGGKAGLSGLRCRVEPIRDGLRLTAEIDLPGGAEDVAVFETPDPQLWVSESVTRREGGRLVSTSDVIAEDGGPVALDRSRLTITVLGDGRAVELRGCPG
jgi:DsbC/DsbD-like thiol-disulfide interchange protein